MTDDTLSENISISIRRVSHLLSYIVEDNYMSDHEAFCEALLAIDLLTKTLGEHTRVL